MNDKFDELTKGMAQSVTRRGALKNFGVGFAGIVLASLGLARKAEAQNYGKCVKWYCTEGLASPQTYYVCGGGRPEHNNKCEKLGVVFCGYCAGCC